MSNKGFLTMGEDVEALGDTKEKADEARDPGTNMYRGAVVPERTPDAPSSPASKGANTYRGQTVADDSQTSQSTVGSGESKKGKRVYRGRPIS